MVKRRFHGLLANLRTAFSEGISGEVSRTGRSAISSACAVNADDALAATDRRVNPLGTPFDSTADSMRTIRDGVASGMGASCNRMTCIMQSLVHARFRRGQGAVGMRGRSGKLAKDQ